MCTTMGKTFQLNTLVILRQASKLETLVYTGAEGVVGCGASDKAREHEDRYEAQITSDRQN